MLRDWLQRQVITPIFQLLRQGITPEKIALSIAFGAVLGSMPAFGITTTLCFIVAYLLRLNPVAIQLVNYLMYPVQIALFIPFIRAGERLFHAHHLKITVSQLELLIRNNVTQAVHILWTAMWHALAVWAFVAPLAVILIYMLLAPVMRRVASRISTPQVQS